MKAYFFKKRGSVFSRIVLMFLVLTPGGGEVNVALHKPAAQSSTHPFASVNSEPENAVDGDLNGHWKDGNSCAHTDPASGDVAQWWMVDLLKEYIITSVHILYRQDKFSTNFGNFVIETFWSNPTVFPNAVSASCYHYKGSNFPGNDTLTCTTPVLGRFLRIRKILPSPYGSMVLCEVTVFGNIAPRFVDENCPFLNRDLQQVSGTYLKATTVTAYGSETRIDCVDTCLRQEGCQGFNYRSISGQCDVIIETWETDPLTPDNSWMLYHM